MYPNEIGYEVEDWMYLDKDRLHSSNKIFRNEGEK